MHCTLLPKPPPHYPVLKYYKWKVDTIQSGTSQWSLQQFMSKHVSCTACTILKWGALMNLYLTTFLIVEIVDN